MIRTGKLLNFRCTEELRSRIESARRIPGYCAGNLSSFVREAVTHWCKHAEDTALPKVLPLPSPKDKTAKKPRKGGK